MSRQYIPKYEKKIKLMPHRLYLAVALLLLAALGTSMWATAPLAEYITSVTDSDGARVAHFAVSATKVNEQSNAISLDKNGTATASYIFTVSNQNASGVNETATVYDVVVTFPSELSGVTLTLRNGTTAVSGTAAENNTVFTFANAGSFPAGTVQTDTLTLTFAMTDDAMNCTWEGIGIVVNAAQQD